MKQRNEARLMSLPKLSVMAVALAFGGTMPAYADDSSAEMKHRIEQLEQQVKRLEALVEKTAAKADEAVAATADSEEQRAEFNRIRVKVEGMEDQSEDLGTKDLKISGMIDPTYIYNRAQDSAGFNFLNNFDGRDSSSVYAYDNSYFGQAMLEFDKEIEGGTKFKLVLAPHKSTSSGYNLGSIVHEANVSMPVINESTRVMAGQFADWSGYEYYFGHQNKLITHNLLFDFTLPSFYTGAGMEVLRGKWDMKALVANMNQVSHPAGETNPILTYRVDYAKGEYSGFGFAGQHGNLNKNRLDMFEVDGYFTRGDWNLQGQIGGGRWKNNAFNGGDAVWAGISTLASYHITPRLEGVVRLDYLNDSKNGGGTIGTALNCVDTAATDPTAPVTCTGAATEIAAGDYRNGFGPTVQDAAAYAADPTLSISGANRSALALGLDYALLPNVMLKGELRFDHADKPVFYYVKDGSYKSDNQVFGVSTAVSF
jgi:hypothetical protein